MKYYRKARFQGVRECNKRCVGNKKCYCQDMHGNEHSLHICSDPDCKCHSRERYEGPVKQEEDDWILVAQVGKIRFMKYEGVVGFVPLKPKDETYEEYHDRLRAQGKEGIPDEVVPEIYDQMDLESLDLLTDLMELE